MVLCAGPLSCNVSTPSCLTRSSILAERRGGSTLEGVSIMFDGTTSASNPLFGLTLEFGEGFSIPVGTLGGVKGGRCGQGNNDGVSKRYGTGSPHS